MQVESEDLPHQTKLQVAFRTGSQDAVPVDGSLHGEVGYRFSSSLPNPYRSGCLILARGGRNGDL